MDISHYIMTWFSETLHIKYVSKNTLTPFLSYLLLKLKLQKFKHILRLNFNAFKNLVVSNSNL